MVIPQATGFSLQIDEMASRVTFTDLENTPVTAVDMPTSVLKMFAISLRDQLKTIERKSEESIEVPVGFWDTAGISPEDW